MITTANYFAQRTIQRLVAAQLRAIVETAHSWFLTDELRRVAALLRAAAEELDQAADERQGRAA